MVSELWDVIASGKSRSYQGPRCQRHFEGRQVLACLGLAGLLLGPVGCATILGIEEGRCVGAGCGGRRDAGGVVSADAAGGNDSGRGDKPDDRGGQGPLDADDEPADGGGNDVNLDASLGGASGGDNSSDASLEVGGDGGLDSGLVDSGVGGQPPGPDASVAPDGGGEPIPPAVSHEVLCDQYCTQMLDVCASLPQFASSAACSAVCNRGMSTGSPDDDGVDTLQCRLHHAQLVADFGEPEVGCQAAGASGGGSCGDVCEVYCTMVQGVCSQLFPTAFDSFTACYVDCQATPRDTEPFQAPTAAGDTLQCRMFHTMNAFGSAQTHCPHALGLELCVP